jgi:hypothetical protein
VARFGFYRARAREQGVARALREFFSRSYQVWPGTSPAITADMPTPQCQLPAVAGSNPATDGRSPYFTASSWSPRGYLSRFRDFGNFCECGAGV